MSSTSEVEYAGFWPRAVACLIDILLILLIAIPTLMGIYGTRYLKENTLIIGGWDCVILFVLPSIAILLYWILRGASPGKIALQLEIRDARTGLRPTVLQYLIRFLAYAFSLVVACVGFFWIAIDPRHQGWHDKLAGTVVVKQTHKFPDTGFPDSRLR